MKNEKKKDILLKNFEIIKNNFDENAFSIQDVVVQMFCIDIDMAKEMWVYLVTKYEEKLKHDSYCLASNIAQIAGDKIGKDKIEKIILDTPQLKRAFFSLMRNCTEFDGRIIRNRIVANELTVADELFDLLYNNSFREASWFSIMEEAMPLAYSFEYSYDITEEAYKLLETWCDKVKDEEERAKLAIKMLDYFV